jgi:DNA invertase Pin-like site-specific DNA recombinase
MLIGYARVSTTDQTLALQQDALTKAGCDQILTDTATGGVSERSGLDQVLSHLRPGDTLVVWRLDRVARQSWSNPDPLVLRSVSLLIEIPIQRRP